MIDFKQQNNQSDKTLEELVRDSFQEHKQVVDVSYFYKDNEKTEL